ncbi:phosphate ABC transporter substrate-binding protein, PhoT family [Leptolyngbyaceae cyanobacterium JSC-12]|nr:phosphate ABC transporter substrate-binding protein, PhoT family [Leptolyngbyaceae cyanobacterium JSC-12]
MTQKSEAPALILAFLVTAGLVGSGVWWLTQKVEITLSSLFSSNNSSPSTPASTADSSNEANPTTTDAQAFEQVKNVPSGLFNYGGSTSWAPIRGQIDPAIQQAQPQFKLRYTDPVNATPGSGSGIRMLLDGQLAFAQSSRPVEDKEYQQAQQRGFTLKQVPVGLEAIAIAVHPSLPVAGLNLEQLKGIYTGKFTNWNQVGGPDLAIVPYSRRLQDGGTVEFFVSNLLAGQPLGSNVQSVYSTTDALRKVSGNPGGIYYASAPEIVPQCSVKPLAIARTGSTFIAPYQEPLVPPEACPAQRNQINLDVFKSNTYPITRQLFVVIKQNGQIEQQAGEAYTSLLLTEQGQQLLNQTGFVRIR